LVAFILATALGASAFAAKPAATPPAHEAWESFWRSVKVYPPPPRDFLEGRFDGKVVNLTQGRLKDETVRAWVLADLRRGRGDSYSYTSLRRDIADAGVFGPPGLNGTSGGIDAERKNGVVLLEMEPTNEVVAAAVIWVPPDERKRYPAVGLSEYIIVLKYLPAPRTGTPERVFADGRREAIVLPPPSNSAYWQLDIGHFADHPVIGPLWYQKLGFSCLPNDGTVMGHYCGLLEP
jgi:hypothetical protein